jgi:DNA-directed RNA polymerase specialized sigma24 family protein
MFDRSAEPKSGGFQLLLSSLDPDEERAGLAYERIRKALIRFFDWRGAAFPEECADETLDRLMKKLEQGVAVIEVTGFALGIARLVHQEALRADARRVALEADPQASSLAESLERERIARYLETCLDGLPEQGRELILRYYTPDRGRSRIQDRANLAREMGMSSNALRSRAQRLRNSLEDCVRSKTGQDNRT